MPALDRTVIESRLNRHGRKMIYEIVD